VKRVPSLTQEDLDDSFVDADPDAKRDLQRLRDIERRLQSFGRKPPGDDLVSSDHSVSGASIWEDEIDYVQKVRQ
jgi:hypothetical protein